MKIIKNNYIFNFLNFICLGILFLNITNNSVYLHSHKLPNGEIVIHAHPFDQHQDKNPIKTHKHSNIEFLIHQNLNIFLVSGFNFVALGVFFVFIKKLFILHQISQQVSLRFKKNKSPPFKIVFNQ